MPKPKSKDVVVSFTVTKDEMAALEAAAKADGRSVENWVLWQIRQAGYLPIP